MKITVPSPADIEAGRSERSGWTKATLAEWGIKWPPKRGWRRRLAEQWRAGKEVTTTAGHSQDDGVQEVAKKVGSGKLPYNNPGGIQLLDTDAIVVAVAVTDAAKSEVRRRLSTPLWHLPQKFARMTEPSRRRANLPDVPQRDLGAVWRRLLA